MLIFCLTAEKMNHFKKTVIFYPLCILFIWLPCVFLGVMANRVTDVPQIRVKQEARRVLATQGKAMTPEARDDLREQAAGDDVILLLLQRYAPLWLAGVLGAGIMAAVMASDSQILALSTMFTEDFFAFYGAKKRFGEVVQVNTGRLFIVLITIVAYAVALRAPETIFELAREIDGGAESDGPTFDVGADRAPSLRTSLAGMSPATCSIGRVPARAAVAMSSSAPSGPGAFAPRRGPARACCSRKMAEA